MEVMELLRILVGKVHMGQPVLFEEHDLQDL